MRVQAAHMSTLPGCHCVEDSRQPCSNRSRATSSPALLAVAIMPAGVVSETGSLASAVAIMPAGNVSGTGSSASNIPEEQDAVKHQRLSYCRASVPSCCTVMQSHFQTAAACNHCLDQMICLSWLNHMSWCTGMLSLSRTVHWQIQ